MTIERRTPTRSNKSGEDMTERLFVQGKDSEPLDKVLMEVNKALGLPEGWIIAWSEVSVHYLSLSWERPATDAEKQEWQERERKQQERTEKWERKTYQRLKEKYG